MFNQGKVEANQEACTELLSQLAVASERVREQQEAACHQSLSLPACQLGTNDLDFTQSAHAYLDGHRA